MHRSTEDELEDKEEEEEEEGREASHQRARRSLVYRDHETTDHPTK